jgi:hypothetical protein
LHPGRKRARVPLERIENVNEIANIPLVPLRAGGPGRNIGKEQEMGNNGSEARALCTACGQRACLGALSRCAACVRAAADGDRQGRAVAEARVKARREIALTGQRGPERQLPSDDGVPF